MARTKYKKKKAEAKRFSMSHPPSERNIENAKAVAESIGNGRHNNVKAVAGSGKTTNSLFTIFDYLPKHNLKAKFGGLKIGFVSFANSIVDEVAPYFEGHSNMMASGFHKFGRRAIADRFGWVKMDKYKVGNILTEKWPALFDHKGTSDAEQKTKRSSNFFGMVKLVHFIKCTLTDPNNHEALYGLIAHFNIDIEDEIDVLVEMAKDVMDENNRMTNIIDFDDMLYFVWKFDLPLEQFDLLVADEDQDFNAAMHHMCQKMAKSFFGVGDDFQAIYGFAGADCNSVANLVKLLGCNELLLDVNYRCGKSIIKQAQLVNPVIQPWDQSPEGCVNEIAYKDLAKKLDIGDMIVCRVNSKLISPAFAGMAEGKPVTIKGQEISEQIIKIHNSVCKNAISIVEADCMLQDYHDRERERLEKRKHVSQNQLEMLDQKVSSLVMFYNQCSEVGDSVSKVPDRIRSIYSNNTRPGTINFTTAHGAKGLEEDRVFIIDYPKIELSHPKQKPWEKKQERHLHYVALTRAKQELNLVNSPE